MSRVYYILFVVFFFHGLCYSQDDTTSQVKVKNKKAVYGAARKATIMSAIIPGLGQIYNKKYWKAPVIYAGMGGFGYFFYINNTSYNNYRAALKYSVANGGYAFIEGHNYSTSQLQTQKLYYRRFRDIGVIGMAAMYILNIIDANVDAHLKTFDVSDDLSLSVDPWQAVYNNGSVISTANGISLKLNFR